MEPLTGILRIAPLIYPAIIKTLLSPYLICDINITSPTGLKNFIDLTGINLAVDFWNYLEN